MASQASRIGDALRKRARDVTRMLALEIDKELRRGTPVDTGHARRNWIPSVGEPNTTEAADESARAQGLAALMAYELDKGAVWVANVVSYIRQLNYGHSTQSPAGFVERAIALALQAVSAKGHDVSGMQDAFARRHENAFTGASPSSDDSWSGGGEY